MLPDVYRSFYLNLQHVLMQLRSLVQEQPLQENFQENSKTEEFAIKSAFQVVQRLFQQVLTSWEQLDPAIAVQMQPYQTEINRQFRLLKMDMIYLQTARQTATVDQRRQQINDRLESLIQYCEAMLRNEESTSEESTSEESMSTE